jgi:helicase
LEVADADIQKRLEKPFALVLRSGRQEMTTRIEVISDVLQDRQRASLSGMVEYGYKGNDLLEIRRSWFVKYNKPVYFQPKEFHELLRKAKAILIPRQEKPEFLHELRDLLQRLEVVKPVVVPVCSICMRDSKLTVLTKRNAVRVSDTQILCGTCAKADLKTDLKSMGITLSKAMNNHLDRQLLRIKSVPRILELLSPGFDPTRDDDLTLVDTLTVGVEGKGTHLSSLPLPEEFKEVLASEGYSELLPVQEMVIEAGLLTGRSLLVVSSTSSGKTLIGEMAGVPLALAKKKMIYLSPLVALTNEKYELFRKRYKSLGLRTGIRVGMSRLDVGEEGKPIVDTDVSRADIICATYEALDLLFRSGETKQLGDIGIIIVDEIQNLADPERGPELDGILARMRFHAPDAQVLALSATVGSPDKLAKELKLELVNYTGRPVPLERHIVFSRNDETKRMQIQRLVREEFRKTSSFGNKGQSIVFTFSRRRANAINDWLKEHSVHSAVYHGGLSYNQRRRIEHAFGKQKYQCVVTTAALGAGVDLPASQVIFESLAMGADWISTAEFEQMLGRAGRLGKHDRGRVYLLVQPERKYHAGQDRYEDEVAANLLAGVIEDVEPFADQEVSAEQILATICSTGLVDLKDVARAYNKMLSVSVNVSDALKHLVKTHMIRVKEGGAYPTELGRATALSFLTPSDGLAVLKMAKSMDVLDIAIKLEPFENVYLSSRLQGEIDTAFKTHMPTRLFSGIFSDLGSIRDSKSGAAKLPKWVFEVFSKWTRDFFNCGCRLYPECDHGKIKLGRWLVTNRKEGLNPTGLSMELHRQYELWVYPGDIYSWLDSLIHNLKAVQRIAAVQGLTALTEEITDQIARIERPRDEPEASPNA